MVNLHHPEVKYPGKNSFFNYTMGGVAQYREEIAILEANGYTSSSHDVKDRDNMPMTVAVLYREGKFVKVYEL